MALLGLKAILVIVFGESVNKWTSRQMHFKALASSVTLHLKWCFQKHDSNYTGLRFSLKIELQQATKGMDILWYFDIISSILSSTAWLKLADKMFMNHIYAVTFTNLLHTSSTVLYETMPSKIVNPQIRQSCNTNKTPWSRTECTRRSGKVLALF